MLSILPISKYDWDLVLKNTNCLILYKKTCFVYFAPTKRLKNQVRRISNWSEILYQINQEILKASKNDHNRRKAV